MNKTLHNYLLNLCIISLCLLGTGCATVEGPANPDDPFEPFNRSMFAFNEQVDKYAFKPVAKGYNFIMPDIASKGVTNFFSNVDDIVVFFNQLLQFKLSDAAVTSARLVFNTTFGLFGLIDVATPMGLPKKNEDFGQTLAVWGVGSGPYLVMPFLGPLTLRDTAGLAVDWTYFDPIFDRQTLRASLVTLTVKYIDIRAGLIKASNILDDTVPDKYSFVRDAWMLRREFLIYDGNPPSAISDEELFNDENLFNDEGLFNDEDLRSESPDQEQLIEEELLNDDLLHEEGMKGQMEIELIDVEQQDPAAAP